MKRLLVVLLVVAICLLSFATTFAAEKKDVPTKVRVIGQSGDWVAVYITVIDLSNNELVVLCYTYKEKGLYLVIRTGMFVNPNEQGSVKGTDGPFPQS